MFVFPFSACVDNRAETRDWEYSILLSVRVPSSIKSVTANSMATLWGLARPPAVCRFNPEKRDS